jgi:phage baseplate assembly protein W
MATMYRGFSTIGQNRKFRLTDFELVKRDILNHFYIRKGEKLMNPSFGTIIWNVLHEPFTEDLKLVIQTDIKNIANSDPRVSFDNIIVTEYDQGIQILLELRYLQTNQVNLMNLQFDNQSRTLTLRK